MYSCLVLGISNSYSSFYRPAAYALAQVVADVPVVLIQVVIFDVIVYLCVSTE